jgi:hypothetical protein
LARVPPNLPTAVRAAATMTMSVLMKVSSFGFRNLTSERRGNGFAGPLALPP